MGPLCGEVTASQAAQTKSSSTSCTPGQRGPQTISHGAHRLHGRLPRRLALVVQHIAHRRFGDLDQGRRQHVHAQKLSGTQLSRG
jgi:hypothetical protein